MPKGIVPGSLVDLLPCNENYPDGELNRYLPFEVRERLLKFIGKEGPYQVVRIVKVASTNFLVIKKGEIKLTLKMSYFQKI